MSFLKQTCDLFFFNWFPASSSRRCEIKHFKCCYPFKSWCVVLVLSFGSVPLFNYLLCQSVNSSAVSDELRFCAFLCACVKLPEALGRSCQSWQADATAVSLSPCKVLGSQKPAWDHGFQPKLSYRDVLAASCAWICVLFAYSSSQLQYCSILGGLNACGWRFPSLTMLR